MREGPPRGRNIWNTRPASWEKNGISSCDTSTPGPPSPADDSRQGDSSVGRPPHFTNNGAFTLSFTRFDSVFIVHFLPLYDDITQILFTHSQGLRLTRDI